MIKNIKQHILLIFLVLSPVYLYSEDYGEIFNFNVDMNRAGIDYYNNHKKDYDIKSDYKEVNEDYKDTADSTSSNRLKSYNKKIDNFEMPKITYKEASEAINKNMILEGEGYKNTLKELNKIENTDFSQTDLRELDNIKKLKGEYNNSKMAAFINELNNPYKEGYDKKQGTARKQFDSEINNSQKSSNYSESINKYKEKEQSTKRANTFTPFWHNIGTRLSLTHSNSNKGTSDNTSDYIPESAEDGSTGKNKMNLLGNMTASGKSQDLTLPSDRRMGYLLSSTSTDSPFSNADISLQISSADKKAVEQLPKGKLFSYSYIDSLDKNYNAKGKQLLLNEYDFKEQAFNPSMIQNDRENKIYSVSGDYGIKTVSNSKGSPLNIKTLGVTKSNKTKDNSIVIPAYFADRLEKGKTMYLYQTNAGDTFIKEKGEKDFYSYKYLMQNGFHLYLDSAKGEYYCYSNDLYKTSKKEKLIYKEYGEGKKFWKNTKGNLVDNNGKVVFLSESDITQARSNN